MTQHASTTWAARQREFAAALVDPLLPAPAFLRTRNGTDVAARLDVYRNNVHASLIDALLAAFPVTARLVSESSFRALARDYLRQELPQHAALHDYGAGLPAFLRRHGGEDSPAWLPDVATLELLWWQAHGAADTIALDAASLEHFGSDGLLAGRTALHPATRLLSSAHPVHAIWAAHQQPGDPRPPARWQPECVLVTRPEVEVRVQAIDQATHAFLAELARGATIEQAALAALERDPSFDLGASLLRVTAAGALLELHA